MSKNTLKLTTSKISERLSNIYEENFKSKYEYHHKVIEAKSCYLNYYANNKELFSDKLTQVYSFRNIASKLIGKKYITELFDVTDYCVLLLFDFKINEAIQTINSLNLNRVIEVPKSEGQFLKHFAFFSFPDIKNLLS